MAKKKSYPVNVLEAMRVDIRTQSNICYENLTDDQITGLNYVLSTLTERERIVFDHYFRMGMSRKKIGEKYHLSESRVKQIIDHALRRYTRNPEWLFYIANGFEAQTEFLVVQLQKEEQLYLSRRGIDDAHIYYKHIEALNFPARIKNQLLKEGVQTVKDLVFRVCSTDRIRNFGELSCKVVLDTLEKENLIPANFETKIRRQSEMPKLDFDLAVFRNINAYN